jgi:hypothetical protein
MHPAVFGGPGTPLAGELRTLAVWLQHCMRCSSTAPNAFKLNVGCISYFLVTATAHATRTADG